MLKAYIIDQLTQVSTWLGILIILFDVLGLRFLILVLGALLVFNNDFRVQSFFFGMKKNVERVWK